MKKEALSQGAVHSVPADLRKVLISDPVAQAKWEDITPLARNEWICWVISIKKPETRRQHIERVRTELKEGMRRPCCWPGCPHRWIKDGGGQLQEGDVVKCEGQINRRSIFCNRHPITLRGFHRYHSRHLAAGTLLSLKSSRSVLEELLLPTIEHCRPQAQFLTQIRDRHLVQKVPPQDGYFLFCCVMLTFLPHTLAPLS